MLSLIESARELALVERRRRNLVFDREPSSFNSWTGSTCLHVDCFHGSWVSHHEEASLEREAALPASSQSTPPSVRASNIDGFPWSFMNLFVTCLDEQFS